MTVHNSDVAYAYIFKRFKPHFPTPKYKVGDPIRISRTKAAFEKGYESVWTKELFKISHVKGSF